jgi:nucleoside 2-deoxyribosyltransferase
MLLIYLASPYSHADVRVRQHRFEVACQAAAALLRAGVAVFSPIAHSHPIARFGLPTSWDYWARLDREYLARCDVLAVLTLVGWRESVGVQAEIALARELGLPVVYVAPEDLESEAEPPALVELRHSSHGAARPGGSAA